MYTHIKGVQILISLLKQYNIKHLVISPGTRNTALAHSVETDPFFTCYSIVDERSAGYFALGIAQQLDVPVCVSCTAATATCNYMPAIKEAYEKNIQLVALTADQDPYAMFHMEDQCIDQVDMFHGFVKCAVDVPKVIDARDYWYFNRCLNEAFLELDHNGKGPIQINYHMSYDLNEISTFDVAELPLTRKIDRYEGNADWKNLAKTIENKKRILVVAGSDYIEDNRLKEAVKEFSKKANCVVLADTYANVFDSESKYVLLPNTLGDILNPKEVGEFTPDLILSFGNIYYATIKYFVPRYQNACEHWQISCDGSVNDGYRSLTKVFECRPEHFFANIAAHLSGKNDEVYFTLWDDRLNELKSPDKKFTHFEAIREFCAKIPENSILHTSVLDAIRISNYVETDPTVKCFANIGADGIDGALSTYCGQAANTEELSFLLIGDLSLMYDMNMLIHKMSSNMRILVINNYAGSEFHKNFGIERIPTIDNLVAAGHSNKIEQCAAVSNCKYMCADDFDSLDEKLKEFCAKSDAPIILEVFTDAHTDAQYLKRYWAQNRKYSEKSKAIISKIVGEKGIEKFRKIRKILRK